MFARVVLALALVLTAFPATATPATGHTKYVAVYPNPLTADDVGEYVVIDFPEHSTGNWTLADGETTVSLPTQNLTGRVALTTTPVATANLTAYSVVHIPSTLKLANCGETLTLRHDGVAVATVAY